jgi:hypothetical protein
MAYDLQAYDSASPYEPRLTTPGSSDVASEISQCLESTGETTVWSPCYICFEGIGVKTYSGLVVVKLLMHEIWMWENEMADENQAKAKSEEGRQIQNDPLGSVPMKVSCYLATTLISSMDNLMVVSLRLYSVGSGYELTTL